MIDLTRPSVGTMKLRSFKPRIDGAGLEWDLVFEQQSDAVEVLPPPVKVLQGQMMQAYNDATKAVMLTQNLDQIVRLSIKCGAQLRFFGDNERAEILARSAIVRSCKVVGKSGSVRIEWRVRIIGKSSDAEVLALAYQDSCDVLVEEKESVEKTGAAGPVKQIDLLDPTADGDDLPPEVDEDPPSLAGIPSESVRSPSAERARSRVKKGTRQPAAL